MRTNVAAVLLGLLSLSTANFLELPLLGTTGSNITSGSVEVFSERIYFYVGGHYVNASGTGTLMTGQIYVERLVPLAVRKKYPLVFISGTSQSGTNWLNTPDGQEGWASFFLRQGYIVYLTDQPERGRSPWLPGEGQLSVLSTETVSNLFIAPERVSPLPYPQAKYHTQWPGSGIPGDAVFDSFYASQLQFQTNDTYTAELNNEAYTALLHKIGTPVFLITHSQAGPFGWQLADTAPSLIQGLVSIEPGTTPLETWVGSPFAKGYLTPFSPMPYGITWLPIHYDPPIGNDASLLQRQNVPAPSPNLAPCILQSEPARQLVNIAQVPQLHIVSQASWHAVGDHCVVAFLRQAGCEVEYVPLETVGILGNGHFLFLEGNNLEIAERIVLPWLESVAV